MTSKVEKETLSTLEEMRDLLCREGEVSWTPSRVAAIDTSLDALRAQPQRGTDEKAMQYFTRTQETPPMTPKLLKLLAQLPPALVTPGLITLGLKIVGEYDRADDPATVRGWVDAFVAFWQGYDDEKKLALLAFAIKAWQASRG